MRNVWAPFLLTPQLIPEFDYLTQAYKLTRHDIHVVLTSTLSSEEYDRATSAARHCANEAHNTDQAEPIGTEAVPLTDPQWDYNTQDGGTQWDRMLRYLLARMNKMTQKAINYDRLREITQRPDENPARLSLYIPASTPTHRWGPWCWLLILLPSQPQT